VLREIFDVRDEVAEVPEEVGFASVLVDVDTVSVWYLLDAGAGELVR